MLARFLRGFPPLLQRENRPGDSFTRPADLPRVPARQSLALWRCDSDACAAGDRRRGHITMPIFMFFSDLIDTLNELTS